MPVPFASEVTIMVKFHGLHKHQPTQNRRACSPLAQKLLRLSQASNTTTKLRYIGETQYVSIMELY